MSNLSVFYNNKLTFRPDVSRTFESESIWDQIFDILTRQVGDWFLAPVRCLFNGKEVEFSVFKPEKDFVRLTHHNIHSYSYDDESHGIKGVLSIIFLVPGVILGTLFKSLSFISSNERQKHKYAVLHYEPLPIKKTTFGSPESPIDLEQIRGALDQINHLNDLHQSADTFVVYAKPDTQILKDPGFLKFNPKKIIFVGAYLVNGPSSGESPMCEKLDQEWGKTYAIDSKETDGKISTVRDAMLHKPPMRLSQFSLKRENKIYYLPAGSK